MWSVEVNLYCFYSLGSWLLVVAELSGSCFFEINRGHFIWLFLRGWLLFGGLLIEILLYNKHENNMHGGLDGQRDSDMYI